jgi:hypothetical protein
MQFEKTKRIEEDLHLEVARLQAHERTLLQQRAELEEDKRQLQTKMVSSLASHSRESARRAPRTDQAFAFCRTRLHLLFSSLTGTTPM